MKNRAPLTDRLLAWLWRTRAVQGLVLAAAAILIQILRRASSSTPYTRNFEFRSPPLLDRLDRFVTGRQTGSPPGKTSAAPAPAVPPSKPPALAAQTPPDDHVGR